MSFDCDFREFPQLLGPVLPLVKRVGQQSPRIKIELEVVEDRRGEGLPILMPVAVANQVDLPNLAPLLIFFQEGFEQPIPQNELGK